MESEPVDNVIIFKSICNFIKDINFAFGDRFPSVQLYAHLLEKTGLFHEDVIKKHVQIFNEFVTINEDAILQKSVGLLQYHSTIRYSDQVFVNLTDVIQLAEAEDLETVWTHLLTILAVLRPECPAKDMLRKQKQELQEKLQASKVISTSEAGSRTSTTGSTTTGPTNGGGGSTAEDPMMMIGNIFQGLMGGLASGSGSGSGSGGDSVGGGQNPFESLLKAATAGAGEPGSGSEGGGEGGEPNPFKMLTSLMSSPVVSNMMNSLGNGEMDMPKMMESMQKTLSSLQTALNDVAVANGGGSGETVKGPEE
jgi:hypothetical protein